MTKAILDTDILSEVMRAKNSHVARNAAEYLREHSRYSLSVMTVAEMVMGWHKIRDKSRTSVLSTFFERHDVIPVGVEEATLAGKIIGDLERLGMPIGTMDPFIAATAIVRELPLATGNTKHFNRIIELGYPLEIQNWREALPNG
jgi:predicted nucleic acid-binding protein